MLEMEKIKLNITSREYYILCAIEEYVNTNSKYYCVLDECGFFIYKNKRKDNKLFWFSEDKNGRLFFGYKEESKTVVCTDDPICRGFYIIKDRISRENKQAYQTKIDTYNKRKRRKDFYGYLADLLNGKVTPKQNSKFDIFQMIRAYFFSCVFEEALLTDSRKVNYSKMRFYDKEYEYGCLNKSDAKYITEYYFCSQIYECVKKYETIFDKTIITDIVRFKKSLIQMIDDGNVCLEKCNGVNSAINLVPQKLVEDIMRDYLNV